MTKTTHVGSTLDHWLMSEALLEHATAKAIKSALTWQLAQTMKARRIGKARLAYELRTSEAAVYRLLDPSLTTVNLRTLTRVALALDMDLEVRLVDRPTRSRRIGGIRRPSQPAVLSSDVVHSSTHSPSSRRRT
jgi:antitoxin HicB